MEIQEARTLTRVCRHKEVSSGYRLSASVKNSMMKSKKHSAVFLSLLAISILIGWQPLLRTFVLSWQNDEYTHILLILPVSAVFVLIDWGYLQGLRQWNFRVGPLILLIAAAIACSAWFWSASLSSDEQLAIRMFALVLAWIGIFLIYFGPVACRPVLFPLLFLFGLVPIPEFLLNSIVALLQRGSAWSAHAFFALAGVPVIGQGVQLTIPGLTIQIAQECSSIRSSSMLVVTTLVIAQVLLRSSWRKALIIILAVPLSVAKNGLRIFTIAMLGTRVNRGYLTGRLHHQGGILFFLIALIAEIALLLLLRRGENPRPGPPLESLQARSASV